MKGWTMDKLRFLAWMDLEVSGELLWFWGCSAGLLGVQPCRCPMLCGPSALVPSCILSPDGGGFNNRDFKTWAANPGRSTQGWYLL